MSEVPTPEQFMHVDTLADMKVNKGWRPGTRTGPSPDPDTRATMGTAEDEDAEGGN